MPRTDSLVVRARTDRAAFGQLFDEFYPGILRYCLRRLFDRAAAEDVTSEIFLRIAFKLPRFRGATHDDFRRWLYRIATNEINAYLRKTRRRQALLEKAVQQKVLAAEEATEPDEDAYDRLDWPAVYEAMMRLKPREQSILTLRYFEGFSHEEIARTLELRPGTVRVALGRALARLRRMLESTGIGHSQIVSEVKQITMTDFNDEQFGRRLSRTSIDDAPQADHRTRLRQQALAAFDGEQSTVSWITTFRYSLSDWRTIMSRPLPRVAASLLVIVVVALGVSLITPDNANTAWADMVETILNAKSAKFKVTVTVEGQQPQTMDAMILEPNRFRQEGPVGMIMIADWSVGKTVSLVPAQKMATVTTITDRPKDAPAQGFFQQLKAQLLEEKNNPKVKREALGEKMIDGHPAVGSRITGPLQTMTIWGDPVSGLPYRIESSVKMMPNTTVVMSDFELNVNLDESLFSLEPPADYTVVKMDVSASMPTEKDLVAALRTFSDKADGSFPDSLDRKSWLGPLFKGLGKGGKPSEKKMQELAKVSAELTRGFLFALTLPEQAEATYAGKGVQRDMVDKPIFWYKPEGADKYRVIYADLSLKDVGTAPQVESAQPLNKDEMSKRPPELRTPDPSARAE